LAIQRNKLANLMKIRFEPAAALNRLWPHGCRVRAPGVLPAGNSAGRLFRRIAGSRQTRLGWIESAEACFAWTGFFFLRKRE
jgi:hypothetical protein